MRRDPLSRLFLSQALYILLPLRRPCRRQSGRALFRLRRSELSFAFTLKEWVMQARYAREISGTVVTFLIAADAMQISPLPPSRALCNLSPGR